MQRILLTLNILSFLLILRALNPSLQSDFSSTSIEKGHSASFTQKTDVNHFVLLDELFLEEDQTDSFEKLYLEFSDSTTKECVKNEDPDSHLPILSKLTLFLPYIRGPPARA